MSKKNRKEKLRLEQKARREMKDKIHRSSGLGDKYQSNYLSMYNQLNGERERFKSPGKEITMQDYNSLRGYLRSLESEF